MGAVISADKAKLHELQTIYGGVDLYDLLEIIMVDSHNRAVAQQHYAKENK
jgi:hypothetical protein